MNVISLPNHPEIEINKLGRLFDNMSESYKLFWFQAIVDKISEGNLNPTFDELINDMISQGWYMVNEYKLNLGPNDSLEKVINNTFSKIGLKSSEKKETIISTLNEFEDKELYQLKRRLTINVPYRLQSPFLDDIKGKDWDKGNLIENINSHDNLLYYFDKKDGLNSTIRINKLFAEYINNNYEIISGWIRYKMIEYLQRRNPSVPGIINKIDSPQVRQLEKVRKYWKEIINTSNIHDIYGDQSLTDIKISIDHFVPWSYVAHDELWNLIPTTKSINSSKSNHLPNWNQYFNKLCNVQYKAYSLRWESDLINHLFLECSKDYINDQDIYHKLYCDNLSSTEFSNRLQEIVEPVYVAARNLGFTEWSIENE